jgi:hypothetical protein
VFRTRMVISAPLEVSTLSTASSVITLCLHVWFREHLYRRHQLPQYACSCCHGRFMKKGDLESHLRLGNNCSPSTDVGCDYDGFDQRQQSVLRLKKNRQQSTEDQKWYEVYQILFPNDDPSQHPTPCKFFPSLPLLYTKC